MSEMLVSHCDSCKWLPANDFRLLESEHWKVVLGPEQHYVGRSFATLKRHAGDLSELTKNEWDDFHEIVQQYEELLRTRLDATLFNWACLMNNAYKVSPPRPHVHWQVKPRYSHPVIVNNKEYCDPEFGHHYDRAAELQDIATQDELRAILLALKP